MGTKYSLVIPVYKNEPTLLPLLEQLTGINATLDGHLEVVFVVDGSPDNSYALLHDDLPGRAINSQLIALSRNFGSFAAIRMGLSAATGPYYAVMAADLQEPPELVLEFFKVLHTEPVDIVMGVRTAREDPWLTITLSSVFWTTYRWFVQRNMPRGGIDVFGCTRNVRDLIVKMDEANSTLVGLLVWMGFRRKLVEYQRRPRPSGKSAWSFSRKLRYMFDSIYAFTDLPILLLQTAGLGGILLFGLASLITAVAWISGAVPIKGYTPLILSILFSASLTLFGLGIVGGYVWRAFENTKQRPLFIPMTHERYPKEE
jgi:glycosyltransferase involved in cell wall biosynthesis